MKKVVWIAVMGFASMGWAIAQDVPPPPPLRGDAANLKDTIKFIQDKLPGNVNYIIYGHDNIAGADRTIKRSFEVSNLSADAGLCSIRFHTRFDNGKNADNIIDRDDEILLKQAHEITLMTMDQVVQRADAKAGHPERSNKIDPPIFLVVVNWGEHRWMMFNFYDESMSDRVR